MKCELQKVSALECTCSRCGRTIRFAKEIPADAAIGSSCPAAPTTSEPRPPCRHLGPSLGMEVCDLCGLKGQPVEVFACEIHGRCTAHRVQRETRGCEIGRASC